MNQIELLINEHSAKVHPEVPQMVKTLGFPEGSGYQGIFKRLPKNKQLWLVAEYHHVKQIRERLAEIALLDPATWPEQFDELAKAQWELTVGTAFEYFENPQSLGYGLLAAAASVIFPALSAEQRMDKLVRGQGWGVREWVKLKQINREDAFGAKRTMNWHAELAVEPSTGLTSWRGVVTDGSRALNAANLLESFASHLPHPVAQRLLQEFMGELKQQYPTLYAALQNYNNEMRSLLSYLDQRLTLREALEQLCNMFIADTKLLTNNLNATAKSHQATAMFSSYLASVTDAERAEFYSLKSGNRTLMDIIQGLEGGMCVEIAAGEISNLLANPAIAATLDRVPQRLDASVTTTTAWVMTDKDDLVQRGMLQHEIPLSLLQSVVDNVRTRFNDSSGIWLEVLMNQVSQREHAKLIKKVLGRKRANQITRYLVNMHVPKQFTILEIIDQWKAPTPFAKISDYAELVIDFVGSKSELPNYLPKTLAQMQWSIKELFGIMKIGLSHEIKRILEPVAEAVALYLKNMLNSQDISEDRVLFLARENAAVAWRLMTSLPIRNQFELLQAYYMPALMSGQLSITMVRMGQLAQERFYATVDAFRAWNDKMIYEFAEFASALMEHLTPDKHKIICAQLLTYSKKTLLNVIDKAANVSSLCFVLESRGLFEAATMIMELVHEGLLDKKSFENYADKLDLTDLGRFVEENYASLTTLALNDSVWLRLLFQKLPVNLAKRLWETVSDHGDIKRQLELSTINRLFVILPREEFDRLYPEITKNILESFCDARLQDLAQFACHALRHAPGFSAWLMLHQTSIAKDLEAMHNLLIMLAFLAEHAEDAPLPEDKELIEHYMFLHRGALYSQYFDLLRSRGHESVVLQLINTLINQVHTIKDYENVHIRCNALDASALSVQCLNRLCSQGLQPGDFAKLVGSAQPETKLQVWQALQHQPILSVINLVDLSVLASTLPVEALQELCTSLQGRVAEIVCDILNFHFMLKGLPEEKQHLLLEWALDVIRPMIIRSTQQWHLLAPLSPAMREAWRPRLPIFKGSTSQQSMFRVTARVINTADTLATSPQPK